MHLVVSRDVAGMQQDSKYQSEPWNSHGICFEASSEQPPMQADSKPRHRFHISLPFSVCGGTAQSYSKAKMAPPASCSLWQHRNKWCAFSQACSSSQKPKPEVWDIDLHLNSFLKGRREPWGQRRANLQASWLA